MIRRLVILGATGDLTSRYLLPALARLGAAGKLPPDFQVRGIAPDDWDTERFRRHAAEHLARRADGAGGRGEPLLVGALDYRRADVRETRQMVEAAGAGGDPAVFYLALPPALAAPAVEGLAALGPAEGSRVVVEKPFGRDLASARALNELLRTVFPEEAVFRMDHFLGKETVLNIVGLRFGNRILEPLWNREHVSRVEILWDETLALEGRAGYYDSAGALRDMIQNHLLQLLCLVAMEPPVSLAERDLRDRKVDLLRAVRRLSPAEVRRQTVRARYAAGRVGDEIVPAYVDEPGVDPARGTETFARVALHIDNWRWADVPFLLRTGKALGRARREIAVHFHAVPHLTFGPDAAPAPNVLRLQLAPDRMSLLVNIVGQQGRFDLEPVELDADLAAEALPAYARLLLEVLDGDATLSIRADEAEESWRIVEPILEGWQGGEAELLEYPAGSDGPEPAGPAR